ncbi:Inositol hexakisphosphate and diphosphoinositol-pentakisphosphate kinase [Eumeta japonica]|uniref:Inositol hexakisphosphate and diphosphoinositol-pentakisphosphate kinase n=1 Tax=Eumeta variegata TaxID=151549 RepID=A0A4C1ZXM2_EUMVA|nr:Inositol hexakisphosphate and diphosphoinositol-pentakisphosphate kinase [Eumeta japonica]
MLGAGARAAAAISAGKPHLFSTAVISGSSSAPNLRIMIPTSANSSTALEGFGGVPAIRPLETLHNALSLRQLDAFLERVTAAPVLVPAPDARPLHPHKPSSPTNSVGWSGPSSLMSSSGEPPSGLSSAGPSSPNSNYPSTSTTDSHRQNIAESSHWSRVSHRAGAWGGESAGDASTPRYHPPGSISGDVTPVSCASDLEFNSNEATAGSLTDHDLTSAEGEDEDDATLSADTCGSPLRLVRNDLSPQACAASATATATATATPTFDFYGLDIHNTKESLYKDMPSSSKNYNFDVGTKNKCTKTNDGSLQSKYLSMANFSATLSGGRSKLNKKNDLLNNGSRRYSDSSAHKTSNTQIATSRFTTTLVSEDALNPSTSVDAKSDNNLSRHEGAESQLPVVTRAKTASVKPGFAIANHDCDLQERISE